MNDLAARQHQARTALKEITEALAEGPGKQWLFRRPTTAHMQRLEHDRDELLYHSHFNCMIPVIECARISGLHWSRVHEIVDRVREEHRARYGLPAKASAK